MTATPIPRTLALLGYGDLDVTALRELPGGRRPISTHVASGERERARAYERIREELRAGRQAYVVCPLVEESEALQARAATAEFERLRDGELSEFEVVLMHGQMKSRDKAAAMERFASGEADVLVATSVIEVGIDVPNATVMLVEDAERYGISQLHQLRGRVGRGEHESVCLLFGPAESARLQGAAGAPRRLPPGRDRPRAARGGRADRHPAVRPRGVLRRAAARGRRAAGPRSRARRAPDGDRPAAARARARPARPRRCSPPTARTRPSRSPRRGSSLSPRHVANSDALRPMRVVAGSLGGRRLQAPKGTDTRPTSDRVREALFSTLGPLDSERVLDLFAGLGRARDRGALARRRAAPSSPRRRAGRSRRCAPTSTRSDLGPDVAEVRPGTSGRRFARHARPPSHTIWSSSTLHTAARRRWGPSSPKGSTGLLAPGARVVTESDRRAPLALGFELTHERRYGDTLIRIHTA